MSQTVTSEFTPDRRCTQARQAPVRNVLQKTLIGGVGVRARKISYFLRLALQVARGRRHHHDIPRCPLWLFGVEEIGSSSERLRTAFSLSPSPTASRQSRTSIDSRDEAYCSSSSNTFERHHSARDARVPMGHGTCDKEGQRLAPPAGIGTSPNRCERLHREAGPREATSPWRRFRPAARLDPNESGVPC